MTMICRFVDGIDGSTLLDLNDEVAYWYLDGSEFPLPEVLYEWVQNALGHGKRLAHWTLDGNSITLKLCLKGSDEQDAYDKLNVLLTRLLRENTLEIRMWGADASVFYKTYPVTPKLPDWSKKFVIDALYVTNVTIEIPVDPEVKTSEETLYLVHALGTNDDFETRSADDFADWEELEVNAGTVTADAVNYHAGSVGCKLTTTAGGTDSAAVRSPYVSVEELETHGLRVWAKELSGAPALDVDVHCYDDTTPAITRLTHPYEVDKFLLDGTASVKDLVTSTAMTMAGAPTTGALLGATAPDIGAAAYTSCNIPSATIGLTAGEAFTMCFVVKTTWQGDDNATHYIFDCQGTGASQNRIFLRKYSSNQLNFYVYDNASAYLRCASAALTAATWAANVPHILIITRSATGVMGAWLDGIPFATLNQGVGTGLETALGANCYFGLVSTGGSLLTGTLLPAIWSSVRTDLVAALSALAAWSSLTDITISGLHTGAAARAYSSTTVKDSGTETAGVVTLTPEGPTRSVVVYEDDSYADEIATYSPTIWGGDTYELTSNYLDTLNILAGHNPADTNFHEVIDGDLIYPSTAGLTPRFPTGTTKVKRTIRNDAAVASAITIDDMWFGSVERISDHRVEGAMGLRTLPGDVKGNLAAMADVHISATTFISLWTEQFCDLELGELLGVSAFDETHVWVVGKVGTILFYDGTNWSTQVSGTIEDLYAVCAISATVAWVVGTNGTILKTTDGGTNWTAQVSGTAQTLWGVIAFDVNTVYAVGDNGTILKTVNGGTNWTAQVSGTANHLYDVSLTDATHVIAVGPHGTVVKTTDGTNWTSPASGVLVTLRGISYLDATHAWAIGASGTIIFSGDAGVSWTPQASGTTTGLYGIWAADSTHVWVGVFANRILFFSGTSWTVQVLPVAGPVDDIDGVSNTSVWAAAYHSILHGVAAAAPMSTTDVIFGESNHYSESWNPVLDAVGATQTALTTRRRSSYRQMVAAATETFLFNAEAHKGTHMITAGVSLGAADANDTFALTFKLQTTGGTDITTQTTTASLHLLFSGAETYTATEFLEICKIAFPRLAGLTIPSEGVSSNAELANINQVVIVTANALLATTLWLDYLALVPTWAKVEVSSWAYNTMILDSRSLKAVLASLDGSLDTAQIYDSTKCLGIPKFTADPNGANYTIVCVNNVTGDDQATFIPDVKLVYNPTYLLVAS